MFRVLSTRLQVRYYKAVNSLANYLFSARPPTSLERLLMSDSQSTNPAFVIIKIGYSRYVIPEEAAFGFFKLLRGDDVYKYDTDYHQGEYIPVVSPMEHDITIEYIPTVRVLWGQEVYRKKQEEKAAKEKV